MPVQVPTVVREAAAALEAGQAVVVGLQSTGEAAADALGLAPGQACGFVSTTREMLSRFVSSHFPTQYEASTDQGAHTPAFSDAWTRAILHISMSSRRFYWAAEQSTPAMPQY